MMPTWCCCNECMEDARDVTDHDPIGLQAQEALEEGLTASGVDLDPGCAPRCETASCDIGGCDCGGCAGSTADEEV